MQEVILHLGLAKTGTTALQRALAASRQTLLEKAGVLYPGTEESHWMLQAAFADNPAGLHCLQRMGVHEPDAARRHVRRFLADLSAEIKAKRPRRVLLSTEFLSGSTTSELHALRGFLESFAERITPCVYVRDPWSFSLSLIQEMARNGQLSSDVELGYTRSNIEIVDKFQHVFDVPMIVLPYAGADQGFDIVEHFLQRTGIPSAAVPHRATARANAMLSRETVVGLLQLHAQHPTFGPDGRYVPDAARDWMMQSLIDAPYRGSRLRMSRMTAEAVRVECATDLKRLQDRYMGGASTLSEQFDLLTFTDDDDRLTPSSVDPATIYDHTLSAMRVLAAFAVSQYTDRVWWTGRYYEAVGNLSAARACYLELTGFPGPHQHAEAARRALAVIDGRVAHAAPSPAASPSP